MHSYRFSLLACLLLAGILSSLSDQPPIPAEVRIEGEDAAIKLHDDTSIRRDEGRIVFSSDKGIVTEAPSTNITNLHVARSPAEPFESMSDALEEIKRLSTAVESLTTALAQMQSVINTFDSRTTDVENGFNLIKSSLSTSFTVAISLRNSEHAPPGFEVKSIAEMKGTDDYVRMSFTNGGLHFGGSSSNGGSYNYLYVTLTHNTGPNYIAFRTYASSSGYPHASLVPVQNGTSCPAGYHFIPSAELFGDDSYSYVRGAGGGLFFGYLDDWAAEAQPYTSSGTFHRYYISTDQLSGGMCFRMYGVDADPSTAAGVYPLFMHTRSAEACPSGFVTLPTDTVVGSKGETNHIQWTSRTSVAGGNLQGWSTTAPAGAYSYPYTRKYLSEYFCWGMFVRTGPTRLDVTTPNSGPCPSGSYDYHPSQIKGTNGHMYFYLDGSAGFIGALQSGHLTDYNNGRLMIGASSQATYKVCIHLRYGTLLPLQT